jgi:predicted phage terminase large subunit-like protein
MTITSLTTQKRQQIAALLAEMESRGIQLSEDDLVERRTWPIDNVGYFVHTSGKNFNPYTQQEEFVHSNARFCGFFGGRGSGKSAAGAQKALDKIKQGKPGVVINPDFENFKLSTWPEFKDWIPWEMVVPSQRYRARPEWEAQKGFTLTFINGAKVICKGLKDPDSARGPNMNWLWYDEAGRDKDGLAWQIAIASIRIGEDPQCFVTTTPRGKFQWMSPFFIEKKIPQDAIDLFRKEGGNRELVEDYHGSIYDNKDNLDPGFLASMLATYPTGYLRQQEIYGKFVSPEGSLGDRAWFTGKILPMRPETVYLRVRFWDLAATEKKMTKSGRNDPDETLGTLMSYDKRHFYVEDQIGDFLKWEGIKDLIKRTAMFDGPAVKVLVEEEPGSGGKNQVAELDSYLKSELPGHPGVEGYRPEGDRVMLANIWFAEAASGLIFLVSGPWIDGFLDQLDEFPEAPHDDKITSVSGARIALAPIRKWRNIPFMSL